MISVVSLAVPLNDGVVSFERAGWLSVTSGGEASKLNMDGRVTLAFPEPAGWNGCAGPRGSITRGTAARAPETVPSASVTVRISPA